MNKSHHRYKRSPEDGKTYKERLQEQISKEGEPKGLTYWGEQYMKKALNQ